MKSCNLKRIHLLKPWNDCTVHEHPRVLFKNLQTAKFTPYFCRNENSHHEKTLKILKTLVLNMNITF